MRSEKRAPLQEAMRLLGRKGYTRQGLKDALLRKGYREEEADRATSRLVSWGYLTDEGFAEDQIARCRASGKGRLFVEHRLIEQGIPPAKAREFLERWYPRSEEESLARELTAGHFAHRAATPGERARWRRSLVASGFSQEAVEASGCWDEET